MKKIITILSLISLAACKTVPTAQKTPFIWQGANVYFLVTDRFKDGDKSNDINFNRTEKAAKLRGFEGGDLRGVIQKIDDGYFSNLGVDAIWLTPLVEQIHGATDEGTGKTYAFHGYWAKDWTAIDPNFGTKKDLRELVEKAHKKGIRILMDVVMNHTGPVTAEDPAFPAEWVRTTPQCTYKTYETTTKCTLVKNLPDAITEKNTAVDLPPILAEKWKKEGRYEKEMSSLDEFFAKNNYPRTPRFYIIKWLADYVREFGIDGFRVDTVKHVDEDSWKYLKIACEQAFEEYKKNNPRKVLDGNPFFTVGELYGYGISQKQVYDFGDKKVNYYQNGFNSLINFDFKGDANKPYEQLFSNYSGLLHGDLQGYSVLNYTASHDDSWPYDKERKKSYENAVKLLLAPGMSQIYYGDESARPLIIPGAEGDANLRSDMNWDDEKNNPETQKLLQHWQKIGKFRHAHPAVGAGIHQMISGSPYWFSRIYQNGNFDDRVIIGLDLPKGTKTVSAQGIFKEGDRIRDAYSGAEMPVIGGKISMTNNEAIVLLEKIK